METEQDNLYSETWENQTGLGEGVDTYPIHIKNYLMGRLGTWYCLRDCGIEIGISTETALSEVTEKA